MAEMVYKVKAMFNFDINDLFYLGRNLDELRRYAGEKKWRVVKEKDGTILDYHGEELLSKTVYISEKAPTYFRAMVTITGLEASPFDLEVRLENRGSNKTLVEYRTKCELPPDFDKEVITSTIDEFRKSLFGEFAKACKTLESERRKKETEVPFVDVNE